MVHTAITLGAFVAGLIGTALAIRALVLSSLRPRPFLIVASMGLGSAYLLALYAGTFASHGLRLNYPEWLFVFMGISLIVLALPLVTGVAFSFTRRNRNVLYRRAWLFSFLIIVALSGVALAGVVMPPDQGEALRRLSSVIEAPIADLLDS